MGTPDYAWVILEHLFKQKDIDIVAVFTQPDKPVGRKQILTPTYVKKMLLKNSFDVEIFQPLTLKDKNIISAIKELKPDFIVVAAYGQILPSQILNIAPCINLHASLLPKYRGASPIQTAILEKEKYSGVTAMLMSEGLDAGDILGYQFVQIKKEMMVSELFDELSYAASSLIVDILREYENINPIKQFDCDSTYAKKIKKIDGEVDFDDADELYIKFRAYTPWPGIFLKNGLKLKKISILTDNIVAKAREIIDINEKSITVSCKKGAILIGKVQPNSKKEMNAKEYIVGKRLKVGDTFF